MMKSVERHLEGIFCRIESSVVSEIKILTAVAKRYDMDEREMVTDFFDKLSVIIEDIQSDYYHGELL